MTGIVGAGWRVQGRVQGVGFRWFVRRNAERLSIVGHAANLPDGSVEVVAFGTGSAIQELERILATGPPLARVTEVKPFPVDDRGTTDNMFIAK